MAKFTNHVHLKSGALHGWCYKCPVKVRHEVLRKVIKEDGPGTVVKRLNFLANVDENRLPELSEVAIEDMTWVRENFE